MIPSNQKLYDKVKSEADKKFLAPTSAYKSAWIVREYKKRGGLFKDDKKTNQGLIRWFKEKWVDINRPNESCGRSKATLNGVYPLCRPTVKITKNTPTLKQELTNKDIKKANKQKQHFKNKAHVKFN